MGCRRAPARALAGLSGRRARGDDGIPLDEVSTSMLAGLVRRRAGGDTTGTGVTAAPW